MGKIRVDTAVFDNQRAEFENIGRKMELVRADVSSVRQNLNWQISSRTQIEEKLAGYGTYMEKLQQKNQSLSAVLQALSEEYQRTESKVSGKVENESANRGEERGETAPEKNDDNKEESTDDSLKKNLGWLESLFKFLDKMDLGNMKWLGPAAGVIAYMKSLFEFYTGDKTGITGASGLLDLADSSISTWTDFFDFYRDKYDKAGFFNDTNNRRVKILDLVSSVLGFGSDFVSAVKGEEGRTALGAIADYIGSMEKLGDIWESGYKLAHLNDVTSLVSQSSKIGIWTPAVLYKAVWKSGVAFTEQTVRSVEKYLQDGSWDPVGDTAAVGIDASVAGLYAIAHTLTFGVDDIIYGAVVKFTGGDTNSELSYAEQAMEGLKIMTDTIGNGIGNAIGNVMNKLRGR